MGFFQHRKLMDDNGKSLSFCEQDCLSICDTRCWKLCPEVCYDRSNTYLPPPPPPPASDNNSPTQSPNNLLVITFSVVGAAFLVLCLFVYCVRFSRNRSNARRRSQPETTETRDDFLAEDHGPIVDHHIWYINTIGLQPSIINSIAVCKYKKGEGLVEGTECSVCLNEFEEDETLRLLPKCSHAFHIPCIDTWLRSHTNCPMCRAPIVSNTDNRAPEVNTEDSRVSEETQVVVVEANGEEQPVRSVTGDETHGEEDDEVVRNERNIGESSGVEDGITPMRRSVSLDFMAASQISQAIANGLSEGSDRNSENESDKRKESSVRIVTRRGAGNQSLLRLMCHSSIGRSLQNTPIFMRRSLSCNGKFSLPLSNNNNKNRNTNPPVRSF